MEMDRKLEVLNSFGLEMEVSFLFFLAPHRLIRYRRDMQKRKKNKKVVVVLRKQLDGEES